MSISKFPSKIIKEDLSAIFYYLSKKNLNINSDILKDKIFIEHSELELNEDINKFCKFIGKTKTSKDDLLLCFGEYFDSLNRKLEDSLHSKTALNIRKQDAYNDLKDLFETEKGSQELLSEINNDAEDIRNFIKNEKEKSKYSQNLEMSIFIFIIINSEYIIRSINNKNLIFTNEKKEIISSDFHELIINLYNKTIELYIREINRIEKITKIMYAIEKSFIEYANLNSIEKAIKKFKNFIELNQKAKQGYQFKENRNLSFFIFYHQDFLYKIINTELFEHLSNLKCYSLIKNFSNSESILINNLNSLTYDKILVKKSYDNNNKTNKLLINYQYGTKVCNINKNSKFFAKTIPSITDGDICLKEIHSNHSLLNTKVELKNIPFDNILKTFCHVLSKYSITLMEEKKPEFIPEKIKKPIIKTDITKLYDKKLMEMAFKGTTTLEFNNNNIVISLEKLLNNLCDINATDKNACTPLILASKNLRSEFIKTFLVLVSNNNRYANFEPNIQDKNGCTALHSALYTILYRSKNTPKRNKLYTEKSNQFFSNEFLKKLNPNKNSENINHGFLTIKRLLKYCTINPNISDNKNNTALHIAVEIGDKEIIEILLKMRTNIDTNKTNQKGQKAIEITKIQDIIKIINHYNEKKYAVTSINHILNPNKLFKNPPSLKQSLQIINQTFKKI